MKLALIGTGKIIEDALFAMEPVKTIERTAVFARPHSRDKAEKLAKQYAIKEVYTDYEELFLSEQQVQEHWNLLQKKMGHSMLRADGQTSLSIQDINLK